PQRIGWNQQQLERRALIVMPDLVRADPMPTADRTGWEQEVDRGQRRPSTTVVPRLDAERCSPDLPVVAALGMGGELEGADQLSDAFQDDLQLDRLRISQLAPPSDRNRLRIEDGRTGAAPHPRRISGSRGSFPASTSSRYGKSS